MSRIKVKDKVKFKVLIAFREHQGIRKVRTIENGGITVRYNGFDDFFLKRGEYKKVDDINSNNQHINNIKNSKPKSKIKVKDKVKFKFFIASKVYQGIRKVRTIEKGGITVRFNGIDDFFLKRGEYKKVDDEYSN